MTYYAVTNDPNELMHFGIKGMKWGILRTPEQLGHHKSPKSTKPRSPAYLKASAKLSTLMQHGIAKAQANWAAYNSPASKAARTNKRNEKAFQKHLELARQGRLKYKNVKTDDEVYRIQDRLAIENAARNLSGKQKQSFGRRLVTNIGDGIVEGVGRGTSSYINERFAARGRSVGQIKSEKRLAAYHNSLQGRIAEKREARAAERKMRRDVRRDADKAYYEWAAANGEKVEGRGKTIVKNVAKGLYGGGMNQISAAMRGETVPSFGEAYGAAFRKQDWSNATRGGRARRVSVEKELDRQKAFERQLAEAAGKSYATNLGKNRAEAEKYAAYYRAYGNGEGAYRMNPGVGADSPVVRTNPIDTGVHQTTSSLIPYTGIGGRRADGQRKPRGRKPKGRKPRGGRSNNPGTISPDSWSIT